MPVLEAMAAGVPVLTSDGVVAAGSGRGERRMLVDPTDVGAIAAGLADGNCRISRGGRRRSRRGWRGRRNCRGKKTRGRPNDYI